MPWQQPWRSWSWMVLWIPTRPFRTNTLKRCPFHYRGLEWKSMKSRDTWRNRQMWTWSTEWSRAKANRVAREHTGHSKHLFPTIQEKTLHTDITRWSTPKSEWLYSLQPKMEKLYTVSKNKTGSWFHHFMANRWGNNENSKRLYFGGLQNHCRWWLQPWN